MTFMTHARKASDPTQPVGVQFVALRSCVEHFSPFGFTATLDHLAGRAGVRRGRWTSEQIAMAVDELVRERQQRDAYLATWDERRRALKRAGRRDVTPDERRDREAMPWLTWPKDKVPARRVWRPTPPPDDAFPFRPAQQRDYQRVRAAMPAAWLDWKGSFDVRLYDDWLRIPTRIYNPPPEPARLARLSTQQAIMLHCLYTRHHDGHIRQDHLRHLLDVDEPWVAPYVVALIGEYVVEIVTDISDGLAAIDTPGSWQRRRYGRFASDNRTYVELVRQRVWSYWREYYVGQFSRPPGGASPRPEYPGFSLVRALEAAAADRT
ncbi:MAG TPA: hypothetical protein DCR14_20905 [Acidimicrobiaceae bacterium]|nr:hypothetical protein [Acidimicrobiaceae bacterium]